MTWLAPFYLAGALAVAAPILFHLWRRTPRGTLPFSTLMFLTPSPPRVTSISRVEHWLLLLLRTLAILLVALAFGRPVWRSASALPVPKDNTQFVAILVDTSASMSRENIWPEVERLVNEQLVQLPAGAIPALFHFNSDWQTAVSFQDSGALADATRGAHLQTIFSQLAPTFHGTDLGNGLVRTAQAIQEAQAERALPCPQRICLVSDLTTGCRLDALREFDWPSNLPLELVPIKPAVSGNAGLQLVASNENSADDRLRVRVSNALDSVQQQLQLVWGDQAQTPCIDVVVPPGQSRVVALPIAPTDLAGQSVVLKGDLQPFDNRLWLPVQQTRECTVIYLGTDSVNDPAGAFYYLSRALRSNSRFDVNIVKGSEPLLNESPPELVIATEATPEAADLLPKLMAAGTNVLLVPRDVAAAEQLASLCAAAEMRFAEAPGEDYALWTEIDYESPWFSAFAEAQFSDFSGIHFWKHRVIQGKLPPAAETLVQFDDGSPAVVHWPGKNPECDIWLMTSGWHPADSQLARSTKFGPLLWRVLESSLATVSISAAHTVGETLLRPVDSGPVTLRQPDGHIDDGSNRHSEKYVLDRPGRYVIESSQATTIVAVNLPPEESRTDPLPLERLEAAGISLSPQASQPDTTATTFVMRQQQLQELEGQQQLWKWLLLIAGGMLILETMLGLRRPDQGPATDVN